jgi:hypothetical protein
MRTRRVFFVVYVSVVIATGAALLATTWLRAGGPFTTLPVERFAFWLFLSLAAECFWLNTPSRAGKISMSLAVSVATLFVLPLPYVLMIGALSVAISDLLIHRRDAVHAYFNGGQTELSLAVSYFAIHLISGASPGSGRIFILEHPFAALCGIAVFFVMNTGLVAGVISLHARIRYLLAWKENFGFGYHFLSSATLALLGLTLVLASESIGYMSGLVYLLFFFFVRDAYYRFVRDRVAETPIGS